MGKFFLLLQRLKANLCSQAADLRYADFGEEKNFAVSSSKHYVLAGINTSG